MQTVRGAETEVYINDSVDRVAHRWATHAIIVSNTHGASSVSINAQSNKTEQSIYECLLGFCFNNIFCAATNFLWLHRQFSSAQFQKRRNDG